LRDLFREGAPHERWEWQLRSCASPLTPRQKLRPGIVAENRRDRRETEARRIPGISKNRIGLSKTLQDIFRGFKGGRRRLSAPSENDCRVERKDSGLVARRHAKGGWARRGGEDRTGVGLRARRRRRLAPHNCRPEATTLWSSAGFPAAARRGFDSFFFFTVPGSGGSKGAGRAIRRTAAFHFRDVRPSGNEGHSAACLSGLRRGPPRRRHPPRDFRGASFFGPPSPRGGNPEIADGAGAEGGGPDTAEDLRARIVTF